MLAESVIKSLALELFNARRARVQVRHFSKRFPQMNIDDGYAIQRAWQTLELASGKKIRGRKIGLTSRAMQQASSISEPDYAPLMDDMFFEHGSEISMSHFIAPRIEVELGFVLLKPLVGPNLSLQDVLNATDYVVPAIEIIDARIEQFDRDTKAPRKVFDTISDFAACAGVVMGNHKVKHGAQDLRWVGAILSKNGVVEETGLAAGVLNNPALGVAWLANKIAAHGEQLNAGDFVLSGSFTRPIAGEAGDLFEADYGPLGSISFRLVD
jgi:2-oxo-hept-3-ene-1,7-dioate hydratase